MSLTCFVVQVQVQGHPLIVQLISKLEGQNTGEKLLNPQVVWYNRSSYIFVLTCIWWRFDHIKFTILVFLDSFFFQDSPVNLPGQFSSLPVNLTRFAINFQPLVHLQLFSSSTSSKILWLILLKRPNGIILLVWQIFRHPKDMCFCFNRYHQSWLQDDKLPSSDTSPQYHHYCKDTTTSTVIHNFVHHMCYHYPCSMTNLIFKTFSLVCRQRSLTQLTKSVVPPNEFEDFKVANEPILGYDKGTKERRVLESALEKYSSETMEVPIVIGDKEYKTDNVRYQVMVGFYMLLLRQLIVKF